jgi:hypothetical protein
VRGVRVRYRDGSTDEWEVKEAMRLERLVDYFRASFREDRLMAFATASEASQEAHDIVGLRVTDVVSWQVIGLTDSKQEAALLDALKSLEDDESE